MKDYEPLDLSPFCNAGPEICERPPATGEQTFHGLPFRVGTEEGKPCFLAFGPETSPAPVSLPI